MRARLEQEIGFADFGKYAREQFIGALPLLGRIRLPDGSFLDSAELAERMRRHFPGPGPQSQVPRGPLNTSPATVASDSTTNPPAPTPPKLTRLPPVLSARVHALLSSQGEPTPSSATA